jgi:hypothetical protein
MKEKNEVNNNGIEKKPYVKPMIEEHDTLEKASGCDSNTRAYVSGYGYYL